MTSSMSLRIRLLEPSISVVTGGSRLLIHGKGFRSAPHSLVVRFKVLLPETATSLLPPATAISSRVDIPGKFLLESQMECVLPSFQDDANKFISHLTKLPVTSATVLCSPQLLHVQVEVILDSDTISNALVVALHQPIVVQKIAPQYVFMAPPTTMTATLNLLRLSNQNAMYPRAMSSCNKWLQEITSMPVFVRIRQVSKRTGAVSEQTREATWKVSAIGVYEIEFDAIMMGFGVATVDVTLNRNEFFRGKDKSIESSLGYHVYRDMTLSAIEPCCISVTSGHMTEVRILGEGFVDSGDLVVALSQREINAESDPDAMVPVAQLNATFYNQSEIRCSVQPNMSFGLTAFHVSLNGGRQFGKAQVLALLHRDRALETLSPHFGSLEGNTLLTIRHACLAVEAMDAPTQIQHLVPPKKIRVRFQGINDDGTSSERIVKVVNAEVSSPDDECGVIRCRTPSFLEEMREAAKRQHGTSGATTGDTAQSTKSDDKNIAPLRIKRFRVSVALGTDAFFGALDFGYYFPPVIRSITMHHGPITGGTSVCLRMKYKVPPRLPILVRFLSLSGDVYKIVPGEVQGSNGRSDSCVVSENRKDIGGSIVLNDPGLAAIPLQETPENHPAFLITCKTPPWVKTMHNLPHLTKVQVSYNGGIEFVPMDDPVLAMTRSPRLSPRKNDAVCLIKDLSYLYFLFYQPPKLHAIFPMSADIHGGSYLRILGENVVDHGAQVNIVFRSPHMSRKVLGFIENGEVRCCAPPFDVGLATIFVSLNAEQYTKCEFYDPDTKLPIDFVFYSSPSLRAISPLCACVSMSSVVSIFGENLIETGRIKVRFSFTTHHGKQVVKDVHGKARNGVITAPSPLFASDFADKHAVVDVALNGYDFSGTTMSLYYFSTFTIKRVEPVTGAFEIPTALSLYVMPQISSDSVQYRVRFKHKYVQDDEMKMFGPVDVEAWTENRVDFVLPAIASFLDTLDVLESVFIDLSFDKKHFHNVGELLQLYSVYSIPHLVSMTPLYGPHEKETEVVARGFNLRESDIVKVSLYLENGTTNHTAGQTAAAVVVGQVDQKRQLLTWRCPALDTILSTTGSMSPSKCSAESMMLPQTLSMQISIIDGQQKCLPFVFRYYKSPRLLSMTPSVGYICSGSLISFEFVETIDTPTVDFRFGVNQSTSGRVRDGRFVECFSPELTKGVHDVALSFNEQHYEFGCVDAKDAGFDATDGEFKSKNSKLHDEDVVSARVTLVRTTFQAFALPLFTIPDNQDRIYAFGPVTGGTIVHIKGRGFIAEAKIYVRFCSPFKNGFAKDISEVVVAAMVLDNQTIQCAAPPSNKQGRVHLHVSYNLQQYTDSQCFFEYHASTRYVSRGILCGPVSGGTPVTIAVEDPSGLPENLAVVNCMIRFQSDTKMIYEDVAADFHVNELTITSVAPAWPSNELVSIQIALSRDSSQQFVDTKIHFLFYDPPAGVIKMEPSAGPISGGTEVMAWCGKIVDTGEVTVSITMYNDGESVSHIGPENASDRATEKAESSTATVTNEIGANDSSAPVILLVKGKIVGEAVTFITPAVTQPCVAYLNISLNGINYTSVHTKSTLRYIFYVEPILRRIGPAWSPIESVGQVLIAGDHIRNYGCKALVRFQLQRQNAEDKTWVPMTKIIDGSFPAGGKLGGCDEVGSVSAWATGLGTMDCCVPALPPGFYEIEISLNGQQFSKSNYMHAKYGNYGGTACTALLPFRCFSSPFFLATPTGPAAGGSTVILYVAKKLVKLLAKETRCQVQFAPVRPTDAAMAVLPASKGAPLDVIAMVGEIDHANGKITCRAPLLRSACAATIDVVLPSTQETQKNNSASSSVCATFGVKERERYYSYESPAIADIVPTCGPTSGGTCLVIEGTNVLDTGQIFVRFRSSWNEREFVVVPGTYSRTFPDGSLSCLPLIICRTPPVEIVDKVVTVEAAGNGANAGAATSSANHTTSNTPRHKEALTGRARMHTFQQLAEQSVRYQQRNSSSQGVRPGISSRVLKITRTIVKNATKGITSADATSNVNVLVDFTLNAGEQFIAHSVAFHYYVEVDPSEITWFPRHLPTRSLDRQPLETRVVTVQLPKHFRLNESPERLSFYFDGLPQPIYWKRRGSSVVLHETGFARELLMLDAPKFKTQATMRRRSTYFRNSSISASSNNLLASSGGNVLPTNVRSWPAPPSQPIDDSKSPSKLSSSSSSQATTSPYIAGKVVRFNELTCPIPDFSCPGAVKVFFSLNAQQFICLGELSIHNPVSIKEADKYRFCSNIGGDRFMLHCSPSTIFNHLFAQSVTNEAHHNEHMFDVAVVKASKALLWERCDDNDEKVPNGDKEPPKPLAPERQQSHRSALLPSPVGATVWREREFHVIRVHLVPPLPRILKKVIVSVSRVDNQIEIGTSVPNESGLCVFEMTDWGSEMLVKASPPPQSGYTAYSAIILEELHYRRRKQRNPNVIAEVSTGDDISHVILISPPPSPSFLKVVVCSPGVQRAARIVLLPRNGVQIQGSNAAVCDEEGVPRDDPHVRAVLIDPRQLVFLGDEMSVFFVGVEFSDAERNQQPTSESNNDKQCLDIQVAVSDHTGMRVFLRGMALKKTERWIIAQAVVQANDNILITSVDRLATSKDDLASLFSQVLGSDNILPTDLTPGSEATAAPPEKLSFIPVAIWFSCADSSRNLSCSSAARLVLPGNSDLATFMGAPLLAQEVKLECAMPELPFNGPTVLLVTFDGITFSNSICIQCYDPRLWRITSLDPPCGLVQKPLVLRVQGENFVDNRKVLIRFSDAARYFTATANVERIHLLLVRVSAIKNLRALLQPLGIPSLMPTSQKQRDDDKILPLAGVSNFTLTLRMECGRQTVFATCRESSVLAMLSSASVLSWEEQFEISVISKRSRILLTLEISDASLAKPMEVARAIATIDSLQDGIMARKSFVFEEHFRKAHGMTAAPATATTSLLNKMPSEIDLFLHLSPLMRNTNVVVCNLQPLHTPQRLRVQISSGDSFYSSCEEIRNSSAVGTGYSSWYYAYDLPKVADTFPKVLPRSAGGEITIHGVGFLDCEDAGGGIIVRVFACFQYVFAGTEEHHMLEEINKVNSLERATSAFFMRDLEGKFVSSSQVTCMIPANLAVYNLYYRVSFDAGREFTAANPHTHVLMYSIDAITPRGGPVSGNTYTALHGTNIHACMSRWDLVASVRLKWMRGNRELESVVVPGEFYHGEDTIYFYSPQSKFGLQNITVHVDLCLCTRHELQNAAATIEVADSGSGNVSSANALALRFGQDEIPFVMYKAPSIKSISPTLGLICGMSLLEVMVQGLDDKAAGSLRHAYKTRFKSRGQMQVADAHLIGDSKFTCIVPRFNVSSAVATPLPETAMAIAPSPEAPPPSSPSKYGFGSALVDPLMKIWNRAPGLYVAVLRARNLQVAKKHTCNPFVVISCNNKVRLKSTRREGTIAPVWNELFDFEWKSPSVSAGSSLPVLRVVVENQLTMDQSEIVGNVEIHFAGGNASTNHAFSLRAWFPLRKIISKAALQNDHQQHQSNLSLGDIELAVSFIPPPPSSAKTNNGNGLSSKLSSTLTLKSSVLSLITRKKQQHQPVEEVLKKKKEKILSRLFYHQSPTALMMPNELSVELALNGQDFWSVAPHRCYLTPTPILVRVEPTYIAISGGTQVHVFGMNFTPTSILRVAFAFASVASGTVAMSWSLVSHIPTIDATRIVVVDAKYRSSTCISCVAPSLLSIATTNAKNNNTDAVVVYVSTNGLDFDSIGLPHQHTTVQINGQQDVMDEERVECDITRNSSPRKRNEDVIVLENERYLVHHNRLAIVGAAPTVSSSSCSKKGGPNRGALEESKNSDRTADARVFTFPLMQHVHLYLIPIIDGVRPSDGIYTSQLTIEGRDFTQTNVAIARFCAKANANDVRTSPIHFVSSKRLECALPDFPRGTTVKMYISINGVEFFACPGELVVFQSPRITELVPHWISSTTAFDLTLRGISFTTQNAMHTPVQVSFVRGVTKQVVKGVCIDGEVQCTVPKELLRDQSSQHATVKREDAAMPKTHVHANMKGGDLVNPLVLTPPILVDIWLGGVHKTFTGMPMTLHIYKEIPVMHSIAPMNGPIYGGFTIDVDGEGFINTGCIILRFELLQERKNEEDEHNDTAGSPGKDTKLSARQKQSSREGDSEAQKESLECVFVDTEASFVSSTRLVCVAPSFPQEGVYMVLVSLNGMEFSGLNATTWFLVWQNWQRRKLLLASHDLFLHPMNARKEDGKALQLPKPLAESDVHTLRRKGSFMLPPPSVSDTNGDDRAFGGVRLPLLRTKHNDEPPSPMRTVMDYYYTLAEEEADGVFVDSKFLHWHPASVADEKGRSLLSLLDSLCNAVETQPIMCRRIGVVFRRKGKCLKDREVRGRRGNFEDFDDGDDDNVDAKTLVLRFNAFADGIRLIFPHALDRELEDLWHHLDHKQKGYISFENMMKRIIREPRSQSPEPGPTHYNPQFSIVESKPPAAMILPETLEAEQITGLPSELFMNYDTFKVVKPRPSAATFPKRKMNASWCNPVAREPNLPGGNVTADAATSQATGASSIANPKPPSVKPNTPRPPRGVRGSLRRGKSSLNSSRVQAAGKRISRVNMMEGVDEEDSVEARAEAEPRDSLRNATPAAPTIAMENNPKDNGSPRTARGTTPSRGGQPPSCTNFSPMSPSNGRNLFYNDIAPLYLKFLNSKEVQKFMKQ